MYNTNNFFVSKDFILLCMDTFTTTTFIHVHPFINTNINLQIKSTGLCLYAIATCQR